MLLLDPSHSLATVNGSALSVIPRALWLTWPDDRLFSGERGSELRTITCRRHVAQGSRVAPIEYDQASSRSLSLAKRDALSPEGNRQQDPRRQDMTLSDDKEQDHA
jgi:hypothetical protein